MSGESKQDPFETLPPEIYQLILTKVDKATLLGCRLLSRYWTTQTDDVLHCQQKSVWTWKSYDPQKETDLHDEFMEGSKERMRVGCVYVKGWAAMEEFGRCVVDGFSYDDDKHSAFNAGHLGPFPSGSAIYNAIHEFDDLGKLITYPEIITTSFGRFLTSFTFGNICVMPMTRRSFVELLSRIPNVKFLKIVGFEDDKLTKTSTLAEEQEDAEGNVEPQVQEPEVEVQLPQLPSLETLILYDPENDKLLNLLLNQYGHQLRHLQFDDRVGYERIVEGILDHYVVDDIVHLGHFNSRRLRDRSYLDIETPLQKKMTSLKDLKVTLSVPFGASIQTHNIPLLERLCLEVNCIRSFRDFDLMPCLQLLNQFHASLKVLSLLLEYRMKPVTDYMGNPVPPYDHSQWDLEYHEYNEEQKKMMDQSIPLLEQITVPADLARNSSAFWSLLRKGGLTLKEVELVGWEYHQHPSPLNLKDIMARDLVTVTAFFNRIWTDYPSVKRIKIHLKEVPGNKILKDVFIATRKMFDEGKEIFRAMYNLD